MNDNIKYNKLKELLLKEFKFEPDQITELGNDETDLINCGYQYIENGDYEQAFKFFKMGALINREDPDILNGLGIALCELGRLRESKIILEKAAVLNPDDSIILSNLAGVCWDQGNPDMAIYYYNKSIGIDSDSEETYINLIYLYLETGSLYMAFITCMNFKNQFPESDEAEELMGEIILNLGISLF